MATRLQRLRRSVGVFALSAGLVVGACDKIPLGADHIGDLEQNPAAYQGKTVKIAGTVTNAFQVPFIGARVYTVRDKTGELPVVTYGELPAVGEKVVARGMFSTVATFGVQSVGPHITIGR